MSPEQLHTQPATVVISHRILAGRERAYEE